jgi:hypothetical protein
VEDSQHRKTAASGEPLWRWVRTPRTNTRRPDGSTLARNPRLPIYIRLPAMDQSISMGAGPSVPYDLLIGFKQ